MLLSAQNIISWFQRAFQKEAALPAVFGETSFLFLTISFFLIGPPGARKHHINSSLKGFIYKSVTFMETVETE